MPGYGKENPSKPYKRFSRKGTHGFTVLRDDRVSQGTPQQAINKTGKRDFGNNDQYPNREKKKSYEPYGDDSPPMRTGTFKRKKARI